MGIYDKMKEDGTSSHFKNEKELNETIKTIEHFYSKCSEFFWIIQTYKGRLYRTNNNKIEPMMPDKEYYSQIKQSIKTKIAQSLRLDIDSPIVQDAYTFHLAYLIDLLEGLPHMHCNSDQLLIEDELVDYINLLKYEGL